MTGLSRTDHRLRHVPAGLRPMVRRVGHGVLAPVGSIASVRTTEPLVALTFDDGPDPLHTPGVLEALERHSSRATFFQLASRAAAYPEVSRRVASEGHEIALHGLDHQRLVGRPFTAVRDAVSRARDQLEQITGSRVRWFRPPYGAQGLRSYAAARTLRLQVVVWTALADDWLDQEPEEVAARALARVRPGTILLLHDGHEPDPRAPAPDPHFDRARAIELLLEGMAAQGLRAGTVGDLLERGRRGKRAWFKT